MTTAEKSIDPYERKMRQESRNRFKALLKGYLAYCNQMIDYNKTPPAVIKVGRGEPYMTTDPMKVRRREEPSLAGFADWLEKQDD